MPKNLFEDDAWLEEKLVESNPFPAAVDRNLDERALNDLKVILSSAGEVTRAPVVATESDKADSSPEVHKAANVIQLNAKSKRTRRWVLGSVAAAAAAILFAIPMGSVLDSSTKATAAPLPLAPIVPSTVDTEKALADLIDAVKRNPDPADFDPGRIDVGHWEGGAYGDGGVFDDRLSIPTFNEHHRSLDGSGYIRQIVGEPFSLSGEVVRYNRKNDMDKPGTVNTYNFGPGEFKGMFETKLGRTPEDFYNSINDQLRPDSAVVNEGPQGFLQVMGFIMMDGKLDQIESASLLGALSKLEGLQVMGTTTDRWDRPAVIFGLEVPNEGGAYRTMLMFNPETGRLTNYMEEFLTDDDPESRGHFDTDMVTRYIAISE